MLVPVLADPLLALVTAEGFGEPRRSTCAVTTRPGTRACRDRFGPSRRMGRTGAPRRLRADISVADDTGHRRRGGVVDQLLRRGERRSVTGCRNSPSGGRRPLCQKPWSTKCGRLSSGHGRPPTPIGWSLCRPARNVREGRVHNQASWEIGNRSTASSNCPEGPVTTSAIRETNYQESGMRYQARHFGPDLTSDSGFFVARPRPKAP